MLSPALVVLNRDAFMVDEHVDTTVALEGHHASSDLGELDSTRNRTPRPHSTGSPSRAVLPPVHEAVGARTGETSEHAGLLFFALWSIQHGWW